MQRHSFRSVWKDAGAVERDGLENRCTPYGYPGFESLSFRNQACLSSIYKINTQFCTQNRKVGCFYIFLTLWAGQKRSGVNILGTASASPVDEAQSCLSSPHLLLPSPIYRFRFIRAYIKPEPNQKHYQRVVSEIRGLSFLCFLLNYTNSVAINDTNSLRRLFTSSNGCSLCHAIWIYLLCATVFWISF